MDFTREPIIETIIAPKDGCRLIIRNTKGNNHEEYLVDSVEIVCFGNSYFFRSLERSKSFLVPITEYEVVETKDALPSLKIPGSDKSNKSIEKTSMALHREESRQLERKPMKRREPRKRASDHNEGGHPKWHSNRDEGRTNLIPPPPDLISKKYHRDHTDNQNKPIQDLHDETNLDTNEIYEMELGREIEPLQHQVVSNEIMPENLPHSITAVEDNLGTSDDVHSQTLLKPTDE